jgi:hypothetical protein
MSGEGWKRRLERAKDLRERLRALDKLRLPICEEWSQMLQNPAASTRRARDLHDRLQALNKQKRAIDMEWNLLWHSPAPAPDPHAVANHLWNYFMSTLKLDLSQGPGPSP